MARAGRRSAVADPPVDSPRVDLEVISSRGDIPATEGRGGRGEGSAPRLPTLPSTVANDTPIVVPKRVVLPADEDIDAPRIVRGQRRCRPPWPTHHLFPVGPEQTVDSPRPPQRVVEAHHEDVDLPLL